MEPETPPTPSLPATCAPTMWFEYSNPVFSTGNKYTQAIGQFTPFNVARSPTIGIRMEDCAAVDDDKGCVVAVVSDGHGSIPVMQEGGQETHLTGGYECANLVTEIVMKHVMYAIHERLIAQAKLSHIGRVLCDAFEIAQQACTAEIERGCISALQLKDIPPSAETRRMLQLGKMDGAHFTNVWGNPQLVKKPIGDKRVLAHCKVISAYGNGFTVEYVGLDQTGFPARFMSAEYGTTCTACIVLPESASRGRIVVANAGDSDCYLFAKNSKGNYQPTRVTTDHSTDNPKEVERVIADSGNSVTAEGDYFCLRKGRFANRTQIMPSRSLGHSLMKHHGITHVPSITSAPVESGDIIVLASDGLWTAKQFGNNYATAGNTVEAANAEMVARILDAHAYQHPHAIARHLRRQIIRKVTTRDNLSIIVIKCFSADEKGSDAAPKESTVPPESREQQD